MLERRKRSFSLNTVLNSIGVKVTSLREDINPSENVIEKLEILPKNYKFVIAGPTGNGKTLLEKLEKSGENIINLEQLNHYGSVLGDINLIQPTQKSFETDLFCSQLS